MYVTRQCQKTVENCTKKSSGFENGLVCPFTENWSETVVLALKRRSRMPKTNEVMDELYTDITLSFLDTQFLQKYKRVFTFHRMNLTNKYERIVRVSGISKMCAAHICFVGIKT